MFDILLQICIFFLLFHFGRQREVVDSWDGTWGQVDKSVDIVGCLRIIETDQSLLSAETVSDD